MMFTEVSSLLHDFRGTHGTSDLPGLITGFGYYMT
jgi:hypothetical protein